MKQNLKGTGILPNPERKKNVNINIDFDSAWKIVDKYWKEKWEWFKKQDYPFDKYDEETFKREINNLQKENKGQKAGHSKIIKYYHKSMNYARKDNCPSPCEGWELLKKDKEVFRKFVFNRITRSDFFKRGDNWKLRDKLDIPLGIYHIGLTTSRMFASCSYLKPNLAKYLIQNYLNDCDTIFNPCHGFSGIALATVCSEKNYVGIDICDYQINEFTKMYKETIKPNLNNKDILCEVRIADSLKTKIDFGKNKKKYGKTAMLVCPPYELLEQWVNSKGEWLTPNLSCTQWIETFLKNYKCDKYIFIVDDKLTDKKYLKYNVNITDNKSHWCDTGKNREYDILITRKERDKIVSKL